MGALLGWLASPATAQEVGRFEVSSLGEGLTSVVGGWYPLFVTFDYRGPAGDGAIEVVNDTDGMRWRTPVELSARTSRRVEVYCLQRHEGSAQLTVRLLRGERVVTSRRVVVGGEQPSALRVLLLGPPELEAFCSATSMGRYLGEPVVVLRHAPGRALPSRVEGYDGVSLIVCCRFDLQRASPLARLALLEWVRRGGELWWAIDAADPLARLAPELRRELPVTSRRELSLTSLAALTELLGGQVAPISGKPFRVAPGVLREGARARAVLDEGAVLADRPLGLGRIGYLGLDPTRPPLTRWDDRNRLLGEMIRVHRPSAPERQLGRALDSVLRRNRERDSSWDLVSWTAAGIGYLLLLVGFGRRLMIGVRAQTTSLWVLPALIAGSLLLALVIGLRGLADAEGRPIGWSIGTQLIVIGVLALLAWLALRRRSVIPGESCTGWLVSSVTRLLGLGLLLGALLLGINGSGGARWRSVTLSWQLADAETRELCYLLGSTPDAAPFEVSAEGRLIAPLPLEGPVGTLDLRGAQGDPGARGEGGVELSGASFFFGACHPLRVALAGQRQPLVAEGLRLEASGLRRLSLVGQVSGLRPSRAVRMIAVWRGWAGRFDGVASGGGALELDTQLASPTNHGVHNALEWLLAGVAAESERFGLPRPPDDADTVELVWLEEHDRPPLSMRPSWPVAAESGEHHVLRIVRLPLSGASRLQLEVEQGEPQRITYSPPGPAAEADPDQESKLTFLDTRWRMRLAPAELRDASLRLTATFQGKARPGRDIAIRVFHHQTSDWVMVEPEPGPAGQWQIQLPAPARQWTSPWGHVRARVELIPGRSPELPAFFELADNDPRSCLSLVVTLPAR